MYVMECHVMLCYVMLCELCYVMFMLCTCKCDDEKSFGLMHERKTQEERRYYYY